MSRTHNIRWTENDSKEIRRTVKNFNAKVKRLEKKYAGQDVVLPEKVSAKELKNLIGTRTDLERELKSLRRFSSKRGSEKLVKAPITENTIYITKWQRTEMNRLKGIVNAKRKTRFEMITDIQMEHRNTPLGYSVGEFGGMRQQEVNALKPVKAFTEKMDKYDISKKFRALRKHAQSDYFRRADRRLLENFLGAIDNTFGEDAKELMDVIREMDFKEFYKKFKANHGQFEYASDIPEDADLKGYLEELKSTWMPEEKPKKKRSKK